MRANSARANVEFWTSHAATVEAGNEPALAGRDATASPSGESACRVVESRLVWHRRVCRYLGGEVR